MSLSLKRAALANIRFWTIPCSELDSRGDTWFETSQSYCVEFCCVCSYNLRPLRLSRWQWGAGNLPSACQPSRELLHCLWPTLNFQQHQMMWEFTPHLLPPRFWKNRSSFSRFAVSTITETLPTFLAVSLFCERNILDSQNLPVHQICVTPGIFEHTKGVSPQY
jgi:hypothetical protein